MLLLVCVIVSQNKELISRKKWNQTTGPFLLPFHNSCPKRISEGKNWRGWICETKMLWQWWWGVFRYRMIEIDVLFFSIFLLGFDSFSYMIMALVVVVVVDWVPHTHKHKHTHGQPSKCIQWTKTIVCKTKKKTIQTLSMWTIPQIQWKQAVYTKKTKLK